MLDTAKNIQSKLEKSSEANLESHIRKLRDETSSNYLTKMDFNDKYNELIGKTNMAENLQKNFNTNYIANVTFNEKCNELNEKINLTANAQKDFSDHFLSKSDFNEKCNELNGKVKLAANVQKNIKNLGTVNISCLCFSRKQKCFDICSIQQT